MAEVFRASFGRRWLTPSIVFGVVLGFGGPLGCSAESTDFERGSRDDAGSSGTSGTDSGGSGSNAGGSSGSAQGGDAGTGPSGGGNQGGRGGTSQGGAGAEDSGGEGAGDTGGNGAASTGGRAGSGATGGRAGMGGKGGTGGKGGMGGRAGAGGTAGMGGKGGTGGAAGSAGTGGSNAGTGGACETQTGETKKYGQRGKSAGFSGSDDQYGELYTIPCVTTDDCFDPCTTRGGSEAMCAATICSDSDVDHCLPSTVWRRLTALRTEGTAPEDGAELVLVYNPYEDFLLVDDFKFEVPASAEIVGITVTIRRSALDTGEAADAAVRLIKGGVIGTSDRSLPQPWSGPEFANVNYGGPTDLWGQTWTPADVNSPTFGVALSALYTLTGGNSRAYVDIVYATIHYRISCQ